MEENEKKSSLKRKILIGLSLLVVLPIALVGIGFLILSLWILPPKKLTPIVLNVAQEYIEADLQVQRINLVFKKTFPNVGIGIDNGIITLPQDSANIGENNQTDTLLHFKKIILAVDVIKYLREKKFSIPFMAIDSLSVYAHVNEAGKPNWDIIKTDTSQKDTSSTPLDFRLKNLYARGLYLQYEDENAGLFLSSFITKAHLKTAIKDTSTYLFAEVESNVMEYADGENDISLQKDLKLNTKLKATDNYRSFHFRESSLTFEGVELMLSGLFKVGEKEEDLSFIDIQATLNTSSIPELVHSLPQKGKFLPFEVKKGVCSFSGKIASFLSSDCTPFVDIACKVEDGEMNLDPSLPNIKDIDLDLNLHIDSCKGGNSFVKIHKMNAKMENNYLSCRVDIDNLLANPFAQGELNTHINLDSLAQTNPSKHGVKVGGRWDANLKFSFTGQDFKQSNYGNMQAEGEMSIDRLLYKNPQDSINLYIHKVDISLKNPELKRLKERRGFAGLIHADSLSVEYAHNYTAKVKYADINLFTIPTTSQADSLTIIPLFAKADLKRMFLKSGDSMAFIARHSQGDFKMFPSKKDKKTPEIRSEIKLDTFLVGMPTAGCFFSQASLTANILKYERDSASLKRIRARKIKRIVKGDTLRKRYSRSLLKSEEESKLLSQWDVKGALEIKKMRLRSKFFPLRVVLSNAKMTYSTNEIHLTQAHLKVGRSQSHFSGDIDRLRASILHGGKLNATLRVDADSIYLNELMYAISQSVALSETTQPSSIDKGNLSNISMETLSEDSLATPLYDANQAMADTSVFMLPKRLNFNLDSKIKWLGYAKGEMSNLQGKITIKNGSMQLTNLGMDSRYGEGMLSLIYSPISPKSAFTGFDLVLKEVQVERLFDLYPPIDTLLPMLKSVEGVVDCKLAVTGKLDSCMNILLPSINAACQLHGVQLVLLDGETFAEISKKLFFKNKKRNLIDSMSVQFLVKDNKVAIFPFLLEMDRYKAAVAGMQGLDMNFNYHISVLKSPLPFKIGVDVKGNLDKYKIKLTKAKLKENRIASTYNIVENARINLAKELSKHLEEIGNKGNYSFSIVSHSTDTLANSLEQTLDSVAPTLSATEDSLLQKSIQMDSTYQKE